MTDLVIRMRACWATLDLTDHDPVPSEITQASVLLAEGAREVEKLREEIAVLRLYGNKDCTAMADEELRRRGY